MPGKLDREILATLKALDERIKNLEETKTIKVDVPAKEENKTTTTPAPLTEETYPVPSEYREAVNSVLNKKFGIKIDPMPDRPAFMFTIVVPREYSNIPKTDYETAGADLRSRVISYGEGVHGVKEWVERVAANLGAEIRAKVLTDRNGA